MPFATKQSDIFYNEETTQMFVCTVSSITADRCQSGGSTEIVYGALPIIYKIDKDTNYKSTIYPKNIDTIATDVNSDIWALTPTCSEGTNYSSITKPLINYNKTNNRYSVTFIGKYDTDAEGFAISNFIFQDINTNFFLLNADVYIPTDKFTINPYTFIDGYLNSDLTIGGNTVRNNKESFYGDTERSPEYLIKPTHVESMSSLGFNLLSDQLDRSIEPLTGNAAFPLMNHGGYITYNPKYTAFDPEHTIRVDFRARSFNVPSMTAYGSSTVVGTDLSTGTPVVTASRWLQQYLPAGPGEGFCVYFHENVCPETGTVVPNGIGSTLGYAPSEFIATEIAGTSQASEGIFIQGRGEVVNDDGTVTKWNDETRGRVANSFLGVGFDIRGNFCMKDEQKPGWYSENGGEGHLGAAAPGTFTQTPCSVGIRGSVYHNTQVLTCIPMNTMQAASAVPMHTTTTTADSSNVPFVDYRIDLSDRGRKVTVYNKLSSVNTYNVIAEVSLPGVINATTEESYDPWENIGTKVDEAWGTQGKLVPLNIGLTFTTSSHCSFFEVQKFEVTGIKMDEPCNVAEPTTDEIDTVDMTNYMALASHNFRERLVKMKASSEGVTTDDKLDIDIAIPAKRRLADIEYEKNIRDEITLCAPSKPEVIEEDICVQYQNLTPEEIDKAISDAELGNRDVLNKFIKCGGALPKPEIVDVQEPKVESLRYGWEMACTTSMRDGTFGDDRIYTFNSPVGNPEIDPLQGGRGSDGISSITSTKDNYTTNWWMLRIGKHTVWVHALSWWRGTFELGFTELDEILPGTYTTSIFPNTLKIKNAFNDASVDMIADNPGVRHWQLRTSTNGEMTPYSSGHLWPDNDEISFGIFKSIKPDSYGAPAAGIKRCLYEEVKTKAEGITGIVGGSDGSESGSFVGTDPGKIVGGDVNLIRGIAVSDQDNLRAAAGITDISWPDLNRWIIEDDTELLGAGF
tara:strand:- start:4510 stop:7410 length:2901 start_codon:yes stop_codon:yes gene_type:complete